MKSLRVVLSVACVAMVACESSAPPVDLSNASIRERSSSQTEAIQNGTLDTTSSNVVAILIGGGQGGICTGSLIAPNLILTARHCVGPISQNNLSSCTAQPFGTPYGASTFRITTSPNAAAAVFTGQAQWPTVNNTTWFTGSQVILAPSPGNTICGGDIALIRLSANINGVCPLIPRVDSQLSANEGYTAIGFGITSPNGQTAGTRYRVTGMSVFCAGDCLGAGESGMSDTYEWFGGAQTAKGTCEGDSGGPSLDSLGRVTGAVSRGDATACNSTVYSGVYGHAQWIKDQTLLAATAGGFTAPAWASGGSTTVNPCGVSDGGTGGGTGAGGGGGAATGGGTGVTGGGGGSPSQCSTGEYCAAIGQAGQSACITNSNGIPASATQCSQTTPCASGASCWATSASSGVCLRDCVGGVTPTGGGSGTTGGGSGTTGGGTGNTGTCPSGQYCVDASGEGDFACISTSNTIPSGAPDCTSTGTCAAGSTCWGISQTQAVCLVDCGAAPTGGGGGSVPTGGGAGNVGGGVGNVGGGAGNVGGGAGNVGGGVGNVGGGVGNVGGGEGQTGGGSPGTDGGLGGGFGGSGGSGGVGNGGFGGGVFAPFGGGGGGASKSSGCSCNTVDPSFLVFGVLALLRRRRS